MAKTQSKVKFDRKLDEPGPLVAPPVHIVVETDSAGGGDSGGDLNRRLEESLRSRLGFRAHVELVHSGSLERTSLKSKLVVVRGKDWP